METKRERLEQLRARFDELSESLAMTGKDRGSDWRIKRNRARDAIRREMEELEFIPPVPIGCYSIADIDALTQRTRKPSYRKSPCE